MAALLLAAIDASTQEAGPPPDAAASVIGIDGFQIDRGAVDAKHWPKVERSLRRQIEIVTSVGLPDEVLRFFRTIPIRFGPTDHDEGGEYQGNRGPPHIEMRLDPIPEDRPVLLHELLHGYHFQVLGQTPEILAAYRKARDSRYLGQQYPRAHFMENPKEYFAVIGSIYLFGQKIDQPPFDCKAVKREQPEFLEFLAGKFGPHECR